MNLISIFPQQTVDQKKLEKAETKIKQKQERQEKKASKPAKAATR